jgi:hypothetical protein
VGLFAGVGIILIGRAAGGLLGIEPLQFRLPWVGRGGAAAEDRSGALLGGAVAMGGETTRAAS